MVRPLDFCFQLHGRLLVACALRVAVKATRAAAHLCDEQAVGWTDELAARCIGFCGADLKAVCTEAALCALRRRYPQIYDSERKKKIDVQSIQIGAGDFVNALATVTPTSQRASASPSRALENPLRPLLGAPLE